MDLPRIDLPSWLPGFAPETAAFPDDNAKMRLAIELAAENVRRKTGGPFGAAIFEKETGLLAAVGVNSVERLNNSVLHAEVLAIMQAQSRTRTYNLNAPHLRTHELFTSCEPCAMCLGAILWSGVRRVVCGAAKADAEAIGFHEGPVFPESYEYLERHGIQIVRNVQRARAVSVFTQYRTSGGVIY